MSGIRFKTKVNPDGKLSLQLPIELAIQELDLVVIYQNVRQLNTEELRSNIDDFYGCLEDDRISVEQENQKETRSLVTF